MIALKRPCRPIEDKFEEILSNDKDVRRRREWQALVGRVDEKEKEHHIPATKAPQWDEADDNLA
jgi:hypothetical protein